MAENKIALDLTVVNAFDTAEKVMLCEGTLLTEIDGSNMAGVTDGSGDESEGLDIEEDGKEIRPMKPSHIAFGKSTIGTYHIEVLKNRHCISDIDLVLLGGEETTLEPKDNEMVIF